MALKTYRDLLAWRKAIELVEMVYRITEAFPPAERFGLGAQMRRAAVSVAANLAEGTRYRRPGYVQRVTIALGEHAELETEAIIAARLGYLSAVTLKRFEDLSGEVGRLTHGLRRALRDAPLRDPA